MAKGKRAALDQVRRHLLVSVSEPGTTLIATNSTAISVMQIRPEDAET
jgi:hypothetical protein